MKRPITTSDMVTRTTRSAETELLRQRERKVIDNIMETGDSLKQYFENVTGESIEPESDRDMLTDLVSMHESEKY